MPITNDDLYAQSWNTNFGSNPFDDGPSERLQNTEDTECIPIQIPDDNHPPSPGSSKNSGGAQWNRPLNQMKIMKMKVHNKVERMTKLPKKNQKDIENSSKNDFRNTPENSQKTSENSQNTPLQEEPINTRGEKYNLRNNPNPNFSDSYRY